MSNKPKDRTYRPLVYICSPLSGDVETNTERARAFCRFAIPPLITFTDRYDVEHQCSPYGMAKLISQAYDPFTDSLKIPGISEKGAGHEKKFG